MNNRGRVPALLDFWRRLVYFSVADTTEGQKREGVERTSCIEPPNLDLVLSSSDGLGGLMRLHRVLVWSVGGFGGGVKAGRALSCFTTWIVSD